MLGVESDQIIIVPMSGLAVSHDQHATLATYALGSCVAVIVYDPLSKIGGMLHFQLPDGPKDRMQQAPLGMYGRRAIPILFRKMVNIGADKNSLVTMIVGGSDILRNTKTQFDVGRRNVYMARKMLWRLRMPLSAEEIGGNAARSVSLRLSDGRVSIRSEGRNQEMFIA